MSEYESSDEEFTRENRAAREERESRAAREAAHQARTAAAPAAFRYRAAAERVAANRRIGAMQSEDYEDPVSDEDMEIYTDTPHDLIVAVKAQNVERVRELVVR